MENQPTKKYQLNRKTIIVGIMILGAAIVSCAILFFVSKNSTMPEEKIATNSSSQKQNTEEGSSIENNSMLVQSQFLFAKHDQAANQTEIYRRPPGADISVKVTTVPGLVQPNNYSRLSNKVAFSVGGELYTSIDGGESFQKIYTAPAKEEITSLRFSKHKSKLAVAVTKAYGDGVSQGYGNKVISINADGKEQNSLFSSADVGVIIKDWSVDSGKVLYQSGCNRCDQASYSNAIYDIKTKKSVELPVENSDTIGSLVLNDAGTKVLYSTALFDADTNVGGSLKAGYFGPPYTIHKYNISTSQDRVVARMGKRIAQPKVLSDIPAHPLLATAGTKYGRQYYYYYDSNITLLFDDNSTKKLIKMPSETEDILFVSEGQVLGTLKTDAGWKLVTFNPHNNERQTLFTAEATMIPLGISDQF